MQRYFRARTGKFVANKVGDTPPKYIGSDDAECEVVRGLCVPQHGELAAFIEHGYQESLALVKQHKTGVRAIAQALIDHPNGPSIVPKSTP